MRADYWILVLAVAFGLAMGYVIGRAAAMRELLEAVRAVDHGQPTSPAHPPRRLRS